ncbi:MAG TPA: VanZ family protein [Vicinamibacterales bacterium]|nr:VanZ family protein [Vicinamibacterales bacterium]
MSVAEQQGNGSRARHTQVLWLWTPVVVYMAGIFFASSVSDPPVPSGVSDVSLHEAAYFGLTLLLIRALARERWSGVTVVTLAAAWAIAVVYGVTDEWHQSFVPNRHAESRDIMSDAIGALAAAVVVGAWSIIRRL